MLSVPIAPIMLCDTMLSVVMLNAVMLIVLAPLERATERLLWLQADLQIKSLLHSSFSWIQSNLSWCHNIQYNDSQHNT
jgi:hypothetical protein